MMGFTDATSFITTGFTNSDNPAGDYAIFRFSTTASDTTIKTITKDGTTQNVQDSGVSPASASSAFQIIFTATTVDFYINAVLVQSHSTNLPRNSVNLRQFAQVSETTTATTNFHWQFAFVQSDK